MSEPAKTDRTPTSADKDHTQVFDLLNSAEMQKRLEEARARREKVLAERAASAADGPPTPGLVQAAATARTAGAGRTPLLLVKAVPKPSTPRVPPQPVGAGPASAPVAAQPVSPPVARRGFQPLGIVVGLALGLVTGAVLMQIVGADAPRPSGAAGVDQASSVPDTPVQPVRDVTAAVVPDAKPPEANRAVAPRARPQGRPDVGLVILPRVVEPEPAAPQVAAAATQPDSPPPAATADDSPGALPAALPSRVTLHLPSDLSDEALADVRTTLWEVGSNVAATRVAGFGVARSEVRFFHMRDAADARRIAERMGIVARDFSTYRPAPPPGTLEVWLARRG